MTRLGSAAPLEDVLDAVEEEIRKAAEQYPEDEASAIVTAGGVAIDAVRERVAGGGQSR